MRRQIVKTALAEGFFSIWMQVFDDDPTMRRMLLKSFQGTASDCFDPNTRPVTPRPPSRLTHGCKL